MTGVDQSQDFKQHLARANLSGARLGYVLSAVLMPAGFWLDLFTSPEKTTEFLWIRFAAAVVAVGLLAVSYLPVATRHPVLLGAGPPFVCAACIQAMISRLDGVVSPYYAGLNLCILSVAVLYNWRWQHALAVCGTIVVVWALPATAQVAEGTFEFAPFFNNLYFLLLTTVIAVASTVIRYRSAKREFDARATVESTSRELATTLEQLRELDRMKNEFFANISHELRTPLTLILSPVEELLSRTTDPRASSALSVVRRNAQRLLRLIDDLLDLARLDAGGLRLRVAEVDLAEIARKVTDSARAAAEAQGIELSCDANEPTKDTHGDMHRLEIVLTNLVGNALKFTPSGGHVAVRLESLPNRVQVSVSDDGPGIAAEDIERIFERFIQVEGSERRRHGGAGIGLSLARELARLHGGDLTVQSELGQGSTFVFELPLGRDHFRSEVLERRRVRRDEHPKRRSSDLDRPSAPGGEQAGPRPLLKQDDAPIRLAGRRARVLVVEDEADLRDFIAETLSHDYDVSVAADGADGLEVVRRERPDVVLTDVMMPRVSGADLCRSIKSDPVLRNTPVIMLTARAGSDATLEGYSAGADDFVAKPFHPRVLGARIAAQLKLRAMGLTLADNARLSTAGTLAAGIAHEVKNPVNAIINAVRVLQKGGSKVPSEKLMTVIGEGAERIRDVVSVLEEHVRPAEGTGLSVCAPDDGVEASLRLLDHRLGHLEVHRQFGATRQVLASPRRLNQVFLNLLDNAIHAASGNIWVSTEDAPGGGVLVRIADDGGGVAHDDEPSLFQPFFTTRPAGEGTGLGLYLCRRIVDDCGGSLSYHAREGGGAEFVLELPAPEKAA